MDNENKGPILSLENVSIRYISGDFKEIGIKEYVLRRITGKYQVKEFWADRDITFSINNVELYTWTCQGDYGDHYGKYTPSWWFIESTKYGDLVSISIRKDGVYFNGKIVNKDVTLSKLNLSNGNKTNFKIEVKEDARHCGGFNVFGEKFGNYNQPIKMVATYSN